MKRIGILISQKAIKLIVLLFAVSLLSFFLVSYSPVDPVQAYIGADMTKVSEAQRAEIAEYWGLNESRPKQYIAWVTHMLQGDFGQSLIYRTEVLPLIQSKFLNSLVLMALAWGLSGGLGFLLGILAGMNEGKWIDRLIKGYAFLLASTPAFWIGLLLLIVFAVWMGLFPIGLGSPPGILQADVTLFERMKHLVLPVITLSVMGVANIALHTREKLIDVLKSEFIRYRRAQGESEWTILRQHGLRHILLPGISLHFATFGELFGGAVVVEQVFSYPGMGQAIVQAGLGGDVPLLLGVVIFSALFVYIGNAIADALYMMIDPRIKNGGLKYE